ncbi:MAG: polymerase sigma factor, sigma-70 family [Humibacillus sp.]|nr:polymerase sigma factor, sigma-70 family [Humibacillus sp.]
MSPSERSADLTSAPATVPVALAADAPSPAPESPAQERALTEAALVHRSRDGDSAAFGRLARAYEAELVRLGFRMLTDVGEAQDAVQDTLLQAWRKLDTLEDPLAFHAWVYQLMTRRCLTLLRRRARRQTVPAPDDQLEAAGPPTAVADRGDGPVAAAQTQAMRDGLSQALTRLPAELRACWVLHSKHDLSNPEIAYAIGVPTSTVRGRIARARTQLAKEMSAWQ